MVQLGTPAQNDNTLAYNDFRLNGVPVVQGPRRPLITDKKFPLWTEWRVGKDPSTGAEGEFWKLIRFESNGDATWVMYPTSVGSGALNDLLDQVGVNVTPDVSGFENIIGITVASGANPSGIPLETVADSGTNTLDVQIQVGKDRTGAPGDKNDAGIVSFSDTQFLVNTDGYVELIGSTPPMLLIDVDFDTAPGTDPVVADGSGVMVVAGSTVANATNLNAPVATHSRAANAYNVEVQVGAAITGAPADKFDSGLSSYNDTQFTVTTHGYVALKGGADLPSIQTLTGDDSVAVGPDASGDIDLIGLAVANATNTKPLYFNGDAALKTQTLELQVATERTGAPGDKNDAGICSFDDSVFSVDADGYVTFVGGGTGLLSVTVDAFTGPGTNPVVPTGGGNITITGAQVATGTIGANVIRTDSLAANTLTIEIQRSTAVAAADSTKNGVSHFYDSHFTVDSNAFVKSTNAGGTGSFANLGIKYVSPTFTITSASGVALSASNPGMVIVPSNVNPGLSIQYLVTSDISFIDDTGASDIAGNTFGTTTNILWNIEMPFYMYAVGNSTDTAVTFMICRLPHMGFTPLAGKIAKSGSALASTQYSMFAIDSTITVANFAVMACIRVGEFQMRKTTALTDDWTVSSPIDPASCGFGVFNSYSFWVYPQNQNGATSICMSSSVIGNTIPVPNQISVGYKMSPSGTCSIGWNVDFFTAGGIGAGLLRFHPPLIQDGLFLPSIARGGGNWWNFAANNYSNFSFRREATLTNYNMIYFGSAQSRFTPATITTDKRMMNIAIEYDISVTE